MFFHGLFSLLNLTYILDNKKQLKHSGPIRRSERFSYLNSTENKQIHLKTIIYIFLIEGVNYFKITRK